MSILRRDHARAYVHGTLARDIAHIENMQNPKGQTMWHNMDERTCLRLHEQDMRMKFRGHGGRDQPNTPEGKAAGAGIARVTVLAAASLISMVSILWSSSIGQQRTRP
jgi:hypothetical protein